MISPLDLASRAALALSLTMIGCSAGDGRPPVEMAQTAAAVVEPSAASPDFGTPTPTASSSATVPATSAPTVATSAPPGPPPTQSVMEKRFLPYDRKCRTDADCGVTQRGVYEPLFCCDGCDAVAGSSAWVKRADAQCAAYDKGAVRHACPPRDCGPQNPPRCHEGVCELTPPRP